MAKRRPAPLYPPPSAVELKSPLKVTTPGELECSDPEDFATLQALSQEERDRFRLFDRLRRYKVVLLQRLAPVVDLTGEHSWEAVVAKLPTITLPAHVPGEIRDAFLALKKLATIHAALIVMKHITPAAEVAICAAIDFGQLLQRGQAELDFAQSVDRGKRSAESTNVANLAKQSEADVKADEAGAEFQRLKKRLSHLSDEEILVSMVTKGRSLRTLHRYKKRWSKDTPTE